MIAVLHVDNNVLTGLHAYENDTDISYATSEPILFPFERLYIKLVELIYEDGNVCPRVLFSSCEVAVSSKSFRNDSSPL